MKKHTPPKNPVPEDFGQTGSFKFDKRFTQNVIQSQGQRLNVL